MPPHTGRCAVCGSRWQMADRRRRYCSAECFRTAQREYQRRRKWVLGAGQRAQHRAVCRRWKQSERGKALIAERAARPEVRARRALLFNAHEEARRRGVNVREVLKEWGAPLGRAGLVALLTGEPPARLNRCRQCGKHRARRQYCSRACFRKARKIYERRRSKTRRRASRRTPRSAGRSPDSTSAPPQSTGPCP